MSRGLGDVYKRQPYNVPCRVNLWEKEWQNIDNAFTNVTLTTSDLGKTYYVKM